MAGALWEAREVYHGWPRQTTLVAILEAKEGPLLMSQVPYSVSQVGHLGVSMVGRIGVKLGATYRWTRGPLRGGRGVPLRGNSVGPLRRSLGGLLMGGRGVLVWEASGMLTWEAHFILPGVACVCQTVSYKMILEPKKNFRRKKISIFFI